MMWLSGSLRVEQRSGRVAHKGKDEDERGSEEQSSELRCADEAEDGDGKGACEDSGAR